MIRYINPTATRHQGRGVLIAEKVETDDHANVQRRSLVYNILALNPDTTDDGLGWQGFNALPAEEGRQTSLAGFSVLRVMGAGEATGATQVVSDERHIYVFRPDGHALLVERFLLVEQPDPNARDGRGFGLVTDWEVRFRRSGSPDLPQSSTDVSAYKNPDGVPFLDPRRYLSLAPGATELDLERGFAVLLMPTGEAGRLQWRLFARSLDGSTLFSYAISRLPDGWFDLEAAARDSQGRVLPTSSLKPVLETESANQPMLLTGHVGAALYQRLEPMVSAEGQAVQMRTANRIFMSCPAVPVPPSHKRGKQAPDAQATDAIDARLLTFDLEVDANGNAAFDGQLGQEILAGDTGPDPLSVAFGLPSYAALVTPVAGSAIFSLQLWLNPQQGPVGANVAGQPRSILSQSGDIAPELRGISLEIIDQFRIRVAFGSGTEVISAITRENVLSYGSWTNISVTCDGSKIQIYLNGAAVAVDASGTPGAAPAGSIDRIGAQTGGFLGQLTETRIWSRALSQVEIRENILEPIQDPKSADALVAYWPMDGGIGTGIADLTGNGHDAAMVGALWNDGTAPLARKDRPINQIDPSNRGLSAGWLKPSSDYPDFGPVQSDARPVVLPTGDGPIHLYYPGPARRFCVARMSAQAQRAFFTGGWTARDGAGGKVETGGTVFITRQTGAYNSFTAIELGAGHSTNVCNVTVAGPDTSSSSSTSPLRRFVRMQSATKEQWLGVPRQLGFFDAILNGRAVADPNDSRITEGKAVFYDYSGSRTQGLLTLGNDALLAGLRFVSTMPQSYSLTSVKGVSQGDDIVLSVAFSGANGSTIFAEFGAVPKVAEAVVDILRGRAADATYLANASSTPVWGLPSGNTHMFVLAPRTENGAPVVNKASFALGAGSRPEMAKFSADLTLGNANLSATWDDVPLDGPGFIKALLAGTKPEQKAVLAELDFLDQTGGARLDADNVKVETGADLRYVTALVAAFREGSGGDLPADFTLACETLQGVTGPDVLPDGTAASALVSVQAVTMPRSGYPASFDLGGTATGQIVLATPGRDGGWLRDSPRYAQMFDGNGALVVDMDQLVPAPDLYEIAGAVTIEGWLMPAESQSVAEIGSETLETVLHFSAAEDGLSYGLAYAPVEAPRFFEQVQFSVSDAAVPAAQIEDRLVRDQKYTVQLYLRPLLLSAGTGWFWKRQAPDESGELEKLSIRISAPRQSGKADGPGAAPSSWRLVFTAGQSEMEAPRDIPANQWTLVTLVRDGRSAVLYIDGEEALRRDDIDQPQMAASRFTVANPKGNEFFEFDPNEFAAWNAPRSAQETRDGFLRPLTGAEPGLVVLFPLSRKEPDFQLTNRARWTTTIYNTRFLGNPFFTKTGLFFDLVASCGDRASSSLTPALAPRRWLHAAAVLNRRGALALANSGSASADGKKETQLSRSFSLDARISLKSFTNARQVIISRFGTDANAQIYEMGVHQDGRAYVTVRLRPVGGGRLSSPDQGLVTVIADADRRITTGAAHHLAASVSLVTVNDSVTQRDVTVLSGEVFVDGLGSERIDPPASGNLADYRFVRIIGGTGSGFYKQGDTVSIETTDPAHFIRWYGTMAGLGFDPARAKTSFVMPSGADFTDRVIAANAFIDPVEFAQAETPTRAGVSGQGGSAGGYFTGQVSDLRLWTEALGTEQVAELAAQPGASPFDDKLVSWWQFSEQSGRLAKDSISGNDLTLTSSTLWTWFDGAAVTFYVNGLPLPAVGLAAPSHLATPRQMRIGGLVADAGGKFAAGLRGQIDELRLWQGQRTREQILINMSRYLTGAEPGLTGYWRFDTGSGEIVADRTIHRGDAHYRDAAGKVAQITWTSSSAPVGFDAPVVNDALDTRGSPEAVELANTPASVTVFEYGDTLILPDGSAQGVLKRSYVFEGISGLDDDTGYKVGDLERIYIGQVQTDPSIIGYMEGAPPLPSENLTRPLTGPAEVDAYNGIATVSLTDRNSQTVKIESDRKTSSKTAFKISVGGAGSLDKTEVIGIPPIQSAIQSAYFQLKLGAQVTGTFESTESSEAGISAGAERSVAQQLANGGQWERKDADGRYFLESGERRFIPGNVGSALVKSQVADLYALRVRSTGALVSITAQANPDIPLDVNIIRFPIDPLYQLAGSLDGQVGLQKAPGTQTSYYKPRQAYTMKRDVERQRQQLEAYYEQTNLQAQLGLGADLTAVAAANPVFKPDLSAPVRDMVNTYVWAAGGGTYAESEGFSTELTESYSLGRSSEIGFGFNFSVYFTLFGGGVTIDGEVTHAMGTSFSTTKSLTGNRSLQLTVEAAPDSFPYRYDASQQLVEEPVPGKVDGYRFMTFFLANRSANAAVLFDEVIDQNWLQNSQDPSAAALRQANTRRDSTAPWRVLHRVTYVSRIPPRFQVTPPLTDRVAAPEAPNQDQNAVFLALVRAKLPPLDASAAEISAAVLAVLSDDVDALLPWWSAFRMAAQTPNSVEQQEFRQITSNAIAYAVSVIGASI